MTWDPLTSEDTGQARRPSGCIRGLVAVGLTVATVASASAGGIGSAVALLILAGWFGILAAGVVHAWRSGELFGDEFAGIEEREQVDRVLRERR